MRDTCRLQSGWQHVNRNRMAQAKSKSDLKVELLQAQSQVRKYRHQVEEYDAIKKRLEATLENLRVHQEELNAQNEYLRQMQEELRESHHKYFDLFESAPIGYFTLNKKGVILEVNITGAELLGFDRKYLVQTRMTNYVKQRDRKALSTHLETIFSGALTDTVELEIKQPDGQPLHVFLESVPMSGENERVVECRTAMLNISERKNLEDQLHRGQKLESLGVLAGGIAHDFNNLLAAISCHVGLVRKGIPSDSALQTHLERIELAAISGGELANQMLIYSGQESSTRQTQNLNQLVGEMGHLLEVTLSSGSELIYQLDPTDGWILADPSQIRQVVLNLITNAAESFAGSTGTIILATGRMNVDQNYLSQCCFVSDRQYGEMVYLEVKDNGCGMVSETIPKIFDPFFTTKFMGRGLGLSALVGVVRAHKGAIHLWSEVGKGTSFRILFPKQNRPPSLSEEGENLGTDKAWRGSGLFLVVDDEEGIRKTTALFLEQAGFSVLTARNGLEALNIFRLESSNIQCVLLDITMPGLSGDKVLQEIRQSFPKLPVILSSGYTREEIWSRFTENSADEFIQKPYSLENLLKKVKKIFPS